ncbi:hypothetical protein MKD41_06455 [Lutibacter sp. A64]|uniref:hypothetical protein n=1 Tax=Lutibacter sp. A64 TaxID=2918526 RepID=UPI001F069474|nr:hypothetical protein [Lutibacter sp. A64]UMB55113.1 hypothetical protein MKD41_06455 [Lutibacter sp. A64]
MKTQTNSIIKSGLLAGFIYALLMAGYDYSNEQDFRLLKFIINLVFFGLFMGILAFYSNKKKNK